MGWLLFDSNVQGGFCLVAMCWWLNYLQHEVLSSWCWGGQLLVVLVGSSLVVLCNLLSSCVSGALL